MAKKFMVWRPESARARNTVAQPQLAAQARPALSADKIASHATESYRVSRLAETSLFRKHLA